MRKILWASCAALTLAAGSLFASGRGEPPMVLEYTASLVGNLDGCDCASHPRAGLVKRAAFLRADPEGNRALLLDAGDIFDPMRDELLADTLRAVYAELGYDAVAVGDAELAGGVPYLLSHRGRPALIAHNLSAAAEGGTRVPFSPDPLIVTKPWGKVAVCALLDPSVLDQVPAEIRGSLAAAPCEEAARVFAARIRGQGIALSVLLYHGPSSHAAALARAVPGFDVIVVGHEQLLQEPVRVGSSILVSPGEQGNRLGRLELVRSGDGALSYRNSFRLFSHEKDPDDPSTRARYDSYIAALRQRLSSGTPEVTP